VVHRRVDRWIFRVERTSFLDIVKATDLSLIENFRLDSCREIIETHFSLRGGAPSILLEPHEVSGNTCSAARAPTPLEYPPAPCARQLSGEKTHRVRPLRRCLATLISKVKTRLARFPDTISVLAVFGFEREFCDQIGLMGSF